MSLAIIRLKALKVYAESCRLIFEWSLENLRSALEEEKTTTLEVKVKIVANFIAKSTELYPSVVGFVDR